jgi:integrase
MSGVKDWPPHDLRRSVVTLLADAVPDLDTSAADLWLQHRPAGVAAIYQRSSRQAAMARVAEAWDGVLWSIIAEGVRP